jgi:hypothetical protein
VNDEILGCILLIANSQPGKQLEILQEVELRLGEQIQAIEGEISNAIAKQEKKNESIVEP